MVMVMVWYGYDNTKTDETGYVKDASVSNLGGQGGAISVIYSTITITSSTFMNNYASVGGAALYLLSSPTTSTIINSLFSYNIAAEGAAIVSSLSEGLTITSSTFNSNTGK
jgi:hypothetical protein